VRLAVLLAFVACCVEVSVRGQSVPKQYLQEDCTEDVKACSRAMFTLREWCGPMQPGDPNVGFLGPVVESCPVWMQRMFDEACLACSQDFCMDRRRVQEQNYFLDGVQIIFSDALTTDWRAPLATCGGVSCSLRECTTQWRVKWRYIDDRCLSNPFEVTEEPVRNDQFVRAKSRGSLPCKPSSCVPVLPDGNEGALYWETTQCMSRVRYDNKETGQLLAPQGAFLTQIYYKSPGAVAGSAGNCTASEISLVVMQLHGSCIPVVDPFAPNVTRMPAEFTSYDCVRGVRKSFTDQFCTTPRVVNGTNFETPMRASFGKCEGERTDVAASLQVLNEDRCTFFTIVSLHDDDDCQSLPLIRSVKDASVQPPGSTCTPTPCRRLLLPDGSGSPHYIKTTCPDIFPETPGTPEGGKGVYLVDKTWMNPECLPGEQPNILYAVEHDKCVYDLQKGDGTFLKLDAWSSKIKHYPSNDTACSRVFEEVSFATLQYYPLTLSSAESGPKCAKGVVCGGTSTQGSAGAACDSRWTTKQVFANQ